MTGLFHKHAHFSQNILAMMHFINISPYQFMQLDLAEKILKELRIKNIPSPKMEIEMTESMLMEDTCETIKILQSLSEAGLKLSIDDFGTGYSSLSYLTKFPITTLKIDRSFVIDLPDKKNAVSVCVAIIQLAHSLGLKVIAEGVETKEQLAFLKEHNCEVVQGYYFAKPMSISDFKVWEKEFLNKYKA